MKFLEQHWKTLNQSRAYAGMPRGDTGAHGFMAPWVHDNVNMDMMERAIRILKPCVIIELGTFEAWGTVRMASVMDSYLLDEQVGLLYTFDAGDAPVNSLGIDYGCAATFEDEPLVDWKRFDPKHPCAKGWKSWKAIMKMRDKRLAQKFKNVKITFIKGLTYDTLPETMFELGGWDFCFQDTLHRPEHMIPEWKLFRDYAHIGSVVVFDDVDWRNEEFVEWMKKNELTWDLRVTKIGHGQLWAEKIK